MARSGNVYLASVEGVVHALAAADGRLRWSHGVAGMPVGEPALDARERLYLATSAPRLYAFHADGRLRWRRQPRARLRTGALWLEPARLVYLGAKQSLYALPSSGDAAERRVASASALWGAGSTVAALSAGKSGPQLWLWTGARRPRRLPLPQPLAVGSDSRLLLAGERVWLSSAGQLHALDLGGSPRIRWSVPARTAAVSADGRALLIDTGGELRWLNAHSGESVYRAPLAEAVSAPPALSNDGLALVPLVSGELLLASPGGAGLARVRVGGAPLLQPVWSETTGQATLAAGDGSLVVLTLRGGPLPERQRRAEPATPAVAHAPASEAR